jgi:TolA-binding protein
MKLNLAPRLLLVAGLLLLAGGCRPSAGNPLQRSAEAKALYERTARDFYSPSAAASTAERQRLLTDAARGYRQLLSQYPEQSYWCAQALSGLGNVCAAQGNTNAALQCWSDLVKKYPGQDWPVLMALKSAADLLWEAGRADEAKVLYQQLVTRFDRADAPQVTATIVRASKLKLAAASPLR